MSAAPTPPAVLVLAGGRSRRMHRDKRLACLGDRSLYERVVNACRFADLPIFVAVAPGDPHLPRLGGEALLLDRSPGEGALAAMADALEQLDRPLLAVAADQPALEPEGLAALLEQAQSHPEAHAVLAVEATGEVEPLLGLYRPSILTAMRRQLDAGRRSLRALVASLPADSWVGWPLAASRLATNLNEPAELARERQRRA